MKKFIALLLSLLFAFSAFAVPISAEDSEKNDDPVVYIDPTVWGDLDSDGKVTAGDARICLRASAKLDKLTDIQMSAADIYGDGEIKARNARKILRVSAKLDIFDCYSYPLDLTRGDKFSVEQLADSSDGYYQWRYRVDDCVGIGISPFENGLIVTQKKIDDQSLESTFFASADVVGRYKLIFTLQHELGADKAPEVVKRFEIIVAVNPASYVKLHVGEQYHLDVLWDRCGIPSEWTHHVSSDYGVDVSLDRIHLVDDVTDINGEPLVGLWPYNYYYTFKAKYPGVYKVDMIYKCAFNETIRTSFSFTIEVI